MKTMAKHKHRLLTKDVLAKITAIVSETQLSVDEGQLSRHSKDMSFHKAVTPEVVIWPEHTEQISQILTIANAHKIPVTAWGGGSSLEGNPIPVSGGIVLDMTRMNKVLEVFPEDLQVRVQPGIIGEELDRQLLPYGLWFAAAPGSKHLATIGGMIANNAGGMHAVKYGVVGDAVLELEVVLADGNVIRSGSRSVKSVSGYDLKRLFIGSEGTLGIITEAVLKLTALPESKIAVLASFPDSSAAAATSHELLKSDIKPASIEFMDDTYVSFVNKAKGASLAERPTLLIELHGNKKIVPVQLTQIEAICKQHAAISYQEFTTQVELKKLWEYRRAVRPVLSSQFPGTGVLSAEVGVPVSQIPGLLEKAKAVSEKYGLPTVMFGHMGDGNFHGWALYELDNEASWKRVVKLNEELIHYAIDSGGTTTGEHGNGIGKRKFLSVEHPTSLPLMHVLKASLDPNGILNPGKLLPG
jgi:D-lactate dehydrogenase (cytochrome)